MATIAVELVLMLTSWLLPAGLDACSAQMDVPGEVSCLYTTSDGLDYIEPIWFMQ